jgi:hypothetical protein
MVRGQTLISKWGGDLMSFEFSCPSCHNKISYSASKCGKCGREVSKEDIEARAKISDTSIGAQGWLGCAAFIGIIWFFGYLIFTQKPEDKQRFKQAVGIEGLKRSAQEDIKAILRDPDSALFSSINVSQRTSARVVCGIVNSRNGFGGMTGGKRFISSPGVISVVEGENIKASEFEKSWNDFC